MAAFAQSLYIFFLIAFASSYSVAHALSAEFYERVCPEALPTIKNIVEEAIAREPRMGASLLRLHFHDCFVNGCDGSVLLDDDPATGFQGEKTANPNANSIRGFDVVDQIKAAVDSTCHGSVVSCADVLAVAARDSVYALGGGWYEVLVGRRDARTASLATANNDIPPPFFNFSNLLTSFQNKGLNLEDLVVLSAAHTIGLARCTTFRTRIYNDTNIDGAFAARLRSQCPVTGGDDNTAPLDATTTKFDTVYFGDLLEAKGLLHSDQELFKGDGSASDGLVRYYYSNSNAFWADFGVSMRKMGNLSPLEGANGEIRLNCRRVNS